MKKIWIMLVFSLIIYGGCTLEKSVDHDTDSDVAVTVSDEKTAEESQNEDIDKTEEESKETEIPKEEMISTEAIQEEVDELVAAEDLDGLWALINEKVTEAEAETVDYMVIHYLKLAENNLTENDPIYNEGWELQEAIYQTTVASLSEHKYDYMIFGQDKELLLQSIPKDYKGILEGIFNKGYGLTSEEGGYYTEIDYIALSELCAGKCSEMTEEFLYNVTDVLLKATTMDGYPNLSSQELADRCVALESFLAAFEQSPDIYTDRIIKDYNIALFQLILPNPYEGVLLENGAVSEELQEVYAKVLASESIPVTNQAVKEFTDWLASKNNIVDVDEMYPVSIEILERAKQKASEIY